MNKSLILTIATIGAISLSACSSEPQENSEQAAFSGTVQSVDLTQMAVDGPAVVTIETEAGGTKEIHVPSMGLPLCPAKDNIADVATINENDTVEVNGDVNVSGAITPCQSEDHYLRVTNS